MTDLQEHIATLGEVFEALEVSQAILKKVDFDDSKQLPIVNKTLKLYRTEIARGRQVGTEINRLIRSALEPHSDNLNKATRKRPQKKKRGSLSFSE